MTDNTTQEEERGSRSAVSVAAERAKQRLVQLDEQEKQRKLRVEVKRDELQRIRALAMTVEWEQYAQIGKERREERQLAFAIGRMVLESLALEGATQTVVGPTEIASLKPETREMLARYIIRRRPPSSLIHTTDGHGSAGTSQG